VASDSTGKYLTAIGYACSKVLTSDDFGATWQYTAAPEQYWGTVSSDSTGQHLVIGPHWNSPATPNQHMMYSANRGKTWTVSTYNNEASTANTFYNQKITGDSKSAHFVTVDDGKHLIHSKNGGASWVSLDNVPSKNVGVTAGMASAISGSGTVMYAVNDAGAMYCSTNSGTSWTLKQNTTSQAWTTFVTDSSGQKLFASTKYTVYASTNYGGTITKILEHSSSGTSVVDIAMDASAKYLYILCIDGLYTYNSGTGAVVKNDLKLYVNQGYGAYSIATSSNGQHIIMSVQPVGLYISNDFGASWTNVPGL
jgi:hypothetical protein